MIKVHGNRAGPEYTGTEAGWQWPGTGTGGTGPSREPGLGGEWRGRRANQRGPGGWRARVHGNRAGPAPAQAALDQAGTEREPGGEGWGKGAAARWAA